ncbi:MAG: transcriptional regulator [Gemmatimonadetes bacterium]|nr:transcriptional regulator [Gemmatimonadota bacterium]|tara:strand:+ start:1581 stop:1865 length:285 start_codon:yes stop_codon:yes gene_type:complete
MKSFEQHLKKQLAAPKFQRHYDQEKNSLNCLSGSTRPVNLLDELRKKLQQARITQQQMSRIENGINCNVITFLKVCQALGLELDVGPKRKRKVA